MKYVAECGDRPEFESEQACLEYERIFKCETEVMEEIMRYLDMQDWSACKTEAALKRERTKAEGVLHGWLAHDIRQNPRRYGVEFDDYDNAVVDAPVRIDEAEMRAKLAR